MHQGIGLAIFFSSSIFAASMIVDFAMQPSGMTAMTSSPPLPSGGWSALPGCSHSPARCRLAEAGGGLKKRARSRQKRAQSPLSQSNGISGISGSGSAPGVTDKLWEIADIVALIEAKEGEKPMVRGTYKKRVAATSV